MIRYELGKIENDIVATRQLTLQKLEPISEDERHFAPLDSYRELADLLIYLTIWHMTVNQGLREIKRKKKPTKLYHAIDKPDSFYAKEQKKFKASTLEEILIQLENMLFQQEECVADFSFAELNERNAYRFLKNIRLGQFITQVTVEKELSMGDAIDLAVRKVND